MRPDAEVFESTADRIERAIRRALDAGAEEVIFNLGQGSAVPLPLADAQKLLQKVREEATK